MSQLLEILGRGLLAELRAAFRDLLVVNGPTSGGAQGDAADGPSAEAARHQVRGLTMLASKDLRQAREAFAEALKIDARDRVSRVGLACVLDELGLTRDALEQLHESLEHFPGDAATLYAIGFCLERLGEPEEAATFYRSALAVAPRLRNARVRLAAISLRLDNVAQAIEQYEDICFHDPTDIGATLALACMHLRTGNVDEAVRRFEFAIAIDPANWDARDQLVRSLIEARRYDEAIDRQKTLVAERPECGDLRLQLGDLYHNVGQEQEALWQYQRAFELNPDYLEAITKIGTCRLRMGELAAAAEAFCRAIELNDRVLGAFVGLSAAQVAAGKTEQARETMDLASAVEPNSTLLFGEVARLHLQLGPVREAERYLSPRAVVASPAGPNKPAVADMVNRQIENIRGALLRHPDHADLHYRLGVLFRHQGKLEDAIASLQKATAINPQYTAANVKLSLAL